MRLLFLSFLCLFFLCFHSFKNNSPWREQTVGLSIAFCRRIPQFHPCVVPKFPRENCSCSHCRHIYLHPLKHCFKVMPRNTFLMFVRETFHKLINVSFWGRSLIRHYAFPTAHLSTPEGFQAGQLPLPFSGSFRVLWDSLQVAQAIQEPLHVRSFTGSCRGHQFVANEETGHSLMQARCQFISDFLTIIYVSTFYILHTDWLTFKTHRLNNRNWLVYLIIATIPILRLGGFFLGGFLD